MEAQNDFRITPKVVFRDTTQLHQVVLRDHSKLVGRAWDITHTELIFQLLHSDEVSKIPLSEVRLLTLLRGNGRYPPSPDLTGLTYLRTAFPGEGKGQFRNLSFVYNVAEFNINRHLQLGAGAFLPFGPLITQRLVFPVAENVHMGFSHQLIAFLLPVGYDNQPIVGDASFMLTVGKAERFISMGAGYLYEIGEPALPNLHIGGGIKVGNSLHLYGEFMFVDAPFEDSVVPGLSVSFDRKRHRWRLGTFTAYDPDYVLVPLPFLGYDYYW